MGRNDAQGVSSKKDSSEFCSMAGQLSLHSREGLNPAKSLVRPHRVTPND